MKFTIVARPNYQDINKREKWVHFFPKINLNSFSIRLRSDHVPLGEAEKTLKAKSEQTNQENSESVSPLEIIHPKSINHNTVRIYGSDKQPNKYYLQNFYDLDTFDTTNQDNLLYLPKLRQKLCQERKQFVEFRNNRDEKRYRYQVIEADELGFPNSLASKKNLVSEGFFKQVGENYGVNPEILELDYNEIDESCYYPLGWLNPVIFTLDLDGSDIEHINNDKDGYLESLNLFLEQSSIIFVEPHIDESYDLRISFLIKLHKLIQQFQESQANNRNFSLVEYFLFGSQYTQSWKPFLALDLLGGKFYAQQKVHKTQETPLISWEPPLDMTPNKQWFANYWRKTWENMQEIGQSQVNLVPPPPNPRPYRPSKGLDTLKFSISSETVPLSVVLVKHPQFTREKTNLYNFFRQFLRDLKRENINTIYDDPLSLIREQNNQLLAFDNVKFWSDFSTNHFVPESPILIAVPKQENRFFDVVNSVNFGAYKLLSRLFNRFHSDREQEIVEFYNDYGWWNDWYSTIFNDRWDVCLRLVERSGFIINKSLLSRDYLGLKTKRVQWENPDMRFSVPTRK